MPSKENKLWQDPPGQSWICITPSKSFKQHLFGKPVWSGRSNPKWWESPTAQWLGRGKTNHKPHDSCRLLTLDSSPPYDEVLPPKWRVLLIKSLLCEILWSYLLQVTASPSSSQALRQVCPIPALPSQEKFSPGQEKSQVLGQAIHQELEPFLKFTCSNWQLKNMTCQCLSKIHFKLNHHLYPN